MLRRIAAVALLAVATSAFPAGLSCDATASMFIELVGFCPGWKAWKVKTDLVLTCPGQPKPVGAVELREYYLVGDHL